MPRNVEIVLPPEQTEIVLREAERLDGVLGIQLSRGASRLPPGDLVTILTTNTEFHELLRRLQHLGLGQAPGASITTTEPTGVICPAHPEAVSRDTTDIPWEEMEFSIARESNMSPNAAFLMFAAGLIAVAGAATGALHLVIGAMVIAPGFEPLVRVGLGLVARSSSWRHGLRDFGVGYVALLAGGVAAGLMLLASGRPLPSAENSYLASATLLAYWTTIGAPSIIVSLLAGAAGALLIANNRSVLTAGVMIALALIPSLAIAGMGLVARDAAIVRGAAMRWAIDVAIVCATSVVVFAIKNRTVHRRPMMARRTAT